MINEEIKNLKRIKSLIDYEDGIEVLKDFILQKENVNYVPTDRGKELFLNLHNSFKEFVDYINNLSNDLDKENNKNKINFPQIVIKELEYFNGEHMETIIEDYMAIDEINSFEEFKTVLNKKYLEYLDDIQPQEYYQIMEMVEDRELIFKSIQEIKNELNNDSIEQKNIYTVFSDLIYEQNKKDVEKEMKEFVYELKNTLRKLKESDE